MVARQPFVTPVPRDLMSSSEHSGHQAHMWYTYAFRPNTHTHKVKLQEIKVLSLTVSVEPTWLTLHLLSQRQTNTETNKATDEFPQT